MNKHGIIEILEFALIVVLVLMCIHYCNRPAETKTETKTEWRVWYDYDTITQYIPAPVHYAWCHDTIVQAINVDTGDSVKVSVPIVRAEYEDSNYHAVVKGGYFAELESIQLYQPTRYIQQTITNTQTVYRKPIVSVVVGVNLGYDPIRKNATTAIGVTVGVPVWNVYAKR